MINYGVYEAGRIERKEQKDAQIIAQYKAFDKFICGMEDEDEADAIIEATGAVLFAITKAEEKKALKELKEKLSPYGIETESAIVWYCHDND